MTSRQAHRPRHLPSNTELADLFQKLADYLAIDGQSAYRIIAYEKVVGLFRVHPTSVAEMALRGGLRDLPGVGQAIETKVLEFVTTGRLSQLEKLSERYPDGLLTLMYLPGIGPKTARKLWDLAHIADIYMLKQACAEGRLRGLPGMGEKTEGNIIRAIQVWEARPVEATRARRLLAEVEPQAAHFVEFLRSLPVVVAADYAGSLRRRRSLVRDIDLVVGSHDPASVMDAFALLPELESIEERGDTKLSAITHTGLGLDLRIVEPAAYGNLLQHFTGSAAHNVALRGYAQKRGLKISEYNVEEVKTGTRITCASEAEVYGR
ncbi:MAG: helix-hairpin-helix domain-containing protein [Actinobacteria bacterium]|nr:helix-hairpin-helix domain-containing protein [Actinomycetota bacterium]